MVIAADIEEGIEVDLEEEPIHNQRRPTPRAPRESCRSEMWLLRQLATRPPSHAHLSHARLTFRHPPFELLRLDPRAVHLLFLFHGLPEPLPALLPRGRFLESVKKRRMLLKFLCE